jgi:predicted PurR-regulated permease PerM
LGFESLHPSQGEAYRLSFFVFFKKHPLQSFILLENNRQKGNSMASNSRPLNLSQSQTGASPSNKWIRRFDIPLTVLAWIALVAVVLWAAEHIIRSLIVLAIAALLAYALAPAVKQFERVMPRLLAILIVYLIVLGGLSVLLYLVIHTIFREAIELRVFLSPGRNGELAPIMKVLMMYGISQDQILLARQQLVSHLEGLASGAFPILRQIFEDVLDIIVVAMLGIYLLLDGSRLMRWLRANAPLLQRERVGFFLDTIEKVVGGYIRGQLTLAVLIGLLVGIGMGVLGVRSAVLLGALAFVFAFIPVLGTFISALACILLALASNPTWAPSWVLAIIVLIYFVVIHAIEAHIVGPRIVGRAIGLHPAVSIFALIAGTELFGIWGALFAAPLAGVLQVILFTSWIEWRKANPEQFPPENHTDNAPVDHDVTMKLDTKAPPSSMGTEQSTPL